MKNTLRCAALAILLASPFAIAAVREHDIIVTEAAASGQ